MKVKRLAAIAALLLLASSAAAALPLEQYNARVFDRVWTLVGKHYWDSGMAGRDWEAIRARYYPQALAAPDNQRLYAVLNEMLDLLGDSHVHVSLPVEVPPPGEGPGPARRAETLPGDILLLGFDGFAPEDDRWIARVLKSEPAPRGIILDLRRNDGGRSDVLDRIAGRFVDRDQVMIRLHSDRTITERTRGAGRSSWAGPLVVLVGLQTASAAEILAFFLDATGRAETVGERTKGAVMGGVTYDLPDGGLLIVSEFDIRTASGVRLEGHGFGPRHIVKDAPGDIGTPRDKGLAYAVALITAGR